MSARSKNSIRTKLTGITKTSSGERSHSMASVSSVESVESHVVDQEDIVTLSSVVRSFKESLGKLRKIFSTKIADEGSKVHAHETLADVLKVLKNILEKYSAIRHPELMRSSSTLINRVNGFQYENELVDSSQVLEAIDQLAISFSTRVSDYLMGDLETVPTDEDFIEDELQEMENKKHTGSLASFNMASNHSITSNLKSVDEQISSFKSKVTACDKRPKCMPLYQGALLEKSTKVDKNTLLDRSMSAEATSLKRVAAYTNDGASFDRILAYDKSTRMEATILDQELNRVAIYKKDAAFDNMPFKNISPSKKIGNFSPYEEDTCTLTGILDVAPINMATIEKASHFDNITPYEIMTPDNQKISPKNISSVANITPYEIMTPDNQKISPKSISSVAKFTPYEIMTPDDQKISSKSISSVAKFKRHEKLQKSTSYKTAILQSMNENEGTICHELHSLERDTTGTDYISTGPIIETTRTKFKPLLTDEHDVFYFHEKGVELALHHFKATNRYTKDFATFVQRRSQLNVDFAHSQARLASAVKPLIKEENFLPFQNILYAALDQELEVSQSLLVASYKLQTTKVVEPLKRQREKDEKTRKCLKEAWKKELKMLREIVDKTAQAKNFYFERCQMLQKFDDENASNASSSSIDQFVYKNEAKRDDFCSKVSESKSQYEDSVKLANEQHSKLLETKRQILNTIKSSLVRTEHVFENSLLAYFEMQHEIYLKLPAQFQNYVDSCREHVRGREYEEFTQKYSARAGFAEPRENPFETVIYSASSSLEGFDEFSGDQLFSDDAESIASSEKSGEASPFASPRQSFKIKSRSYGSGSVSSGELDSDIYAANEEAAYRSGHVSRAAETHSFRKLKTPSRCRECDSYVYFHGFECGECGLSCHKKCLETLAIQCGHKRLHRKLTTFGVDLKQHLQDTNSNVPHIVTKCVYEIENKGANAKGIYRVSGLKSRVEKLCQAFENGSHLVDLTDQTPNVIANVLKLYLRQLPEPLLTFKLYAEFIRIGKDFSQKELEDSLSPDLAPLKQLVKKLPPHHFWCLGVLMLHLNKIADHADLNNMPPSNLGIVFGPTLLRPPEGSASLNSLIDTVHQTKIVEILVIFAKDIFGSAETILPKPLQKGSFVHLQPEQFPIDSSPALSAKMTTSNSLIASAKHYSKNKKTDEKSWRTKSASRPVSMQTAFSNFTSSVRTTTSSLDADLLQTDSHRVNKENKIQGRKSPKILKSPRSSKKAKESDPKVEVSLKAKSQIGPPPVEQAIFSYSDSHILKTSLKDYVGLEVATLRETLSPGLETSSHAKLKKSLSDTPSIASATIENLPNRYSDSEFFVVQTNTPTAPVQTFTDKISFIPNLGENSGQNVTHSDSVTPQMYGDKIYIQHQLSAKNNDSTVKMISKVENSVEDDDIVKNLKVIDTKSTESLESTRKSIESIESAKISTENLDISKKSTESLDSSIKYTESSLGSSRKSIDSLDSNKKSNESLDSSKKMMLDTSKDKGKTISLDNLSTSDSYSVELQTESSQSSLDTHDGNTPSSISNVSHGYSTDSLNMDWGSSSVPGSTASSTSCPNKAAISEIQSIFQFPAPEQFNVLSNPANGLFISSSTGNLLPGTRSEHLYLLSPKNFDVHSTSAKKQNIYLPSPENVILQPSEYLPVQTPEIIQSDSEYLNQAAAGHIPVNMSTAVSASIPSSTESLPMNLHISSVQKSIVAGTTTAKNASTLTRSLYKSISDSTFKLHQEKSVLKTTSEATKAFTTDLAGERNSIPMTIDVEDQRIETVPISSTTDLAHDKPNTANFENHVID